MTIALTLLALLLGALPSAGKPGLVTRFSTPARLTVGDRFEVKVVVRSAHPSLVTGPLAEADSAFVVADEKRSFARRGGQDETTYRLSVACFVPGRHRTPAFAFLVSGAGRSDTLLSDTTSVTVASVLPADMKDIRGLKPPEDFPNPWLWLAPAIALALAALALLARRLWQRMRADAGAARPLPPPWDEALAALDALPRSEWIAAGEARRLHYALSEILKRYVERRFGFEAVEQTTTELLASMRAQKLPLRDEVARFFARCDLVKYAKWVPPPGDSERACEEVREFVLRTRPAEPAPDAPAAEPAARAAGGA